MRPTHIRAVPGGNATTSGPLTPKTVLLWALGRSGPRNLCPRKMLTDLRNALEQRDEAGFDGGAAIPPKGAVRSRPFRAAGCHRGQAAA